MSRRPARIALLLAAFLAGGAAPAAAQEQAPTSFGPTGGTEAESGDPRLVVRPAALLRRTLAINGAVDSGDAGRTIRIDRQDADGTWLPVAAATIAEDGTYAARWRTDSAGRHTLRAVVVREGARAAEAPPTAKVTVFRRQVASWYGPGFFGRRTACGTRLRKKTLGVAHRTLPCGTQVELYHRGRTITVPVIDRGPFIRGRTWDLTAATARALGVRATVGVGALPAE